MSQSDDRDRPHTAQEHPPVSFSVSPTNNQLAATTSTAAFFGAAISRFGCPKGSSPRRKTVSSKFVPIRWATAPYTRFEQLEGEDKVEGVAVVEFPSFERAKEWYNSRAYRDIRRYRTQGAKYIGVIAEGGALPPDQRMPQTKGRRPQSGTR
jgi:hypothetical protein